MTKQETAKIYIDFLDTLLGIGLENIENGHILDSPEAQLMDSLAELNENLAEYLQNKGKIK